jgi:hypothetical protein
MWFESQLGFSVLIYPGTNIYINWSTLDRHPKICGSNPNLFCPYLCCNIEPTCKFIFQIIRLYETVPDLFCHNAPLKNAYLEVKISIY